MTTSDDSPDGLPDDVERWPADPRKLFGLSPNATRRELKRAYIALIKRFKPEHAPDQFRRIREAYEELDQIWKWKQLIEDRNSLDANEMVDSSEQTEVTERSQFGGSLDSSPTLFRSEVSEVNSDADALWQEALSGGSIASVYSRLSELAFGQLVSDEVFLRLYWLQTLHAIVEPERDPAWWLVRGIRRCSQKDRLIATLTIDLNSRTKPAYCMVEDDVLDPSFPTDVLIDLASLRWFTARQLCRFEIVDDDLARLEPCFSNDAPKWSRLLDEALRKAVFVRNEGAINLVERVLARFKPLLECYDFENHVTFNEVVAELHMKWIRGFDELDDSKYSLKRNPLFNRKLDTRPKPSITSTKALLQQILKLFENCWEKPVIDARSKILAFCTTLMNQYRTSLDQLTSICQVATPFVHELIVMIQSQIYDSSKEDAYELTDAVKRCLIRFVQGPLWTDESWQPVVLDFCLENAVLPNDIATTIEENHSHLPAHALEDALEMAHAIRQNFAITCLAVASRLLH